MWMNYIDIDILKGKNMIAHTFAFGEEVVPLFEVWHTSSELSEPAKLLKSLGREACIVIEPTSNYQHQYLGCSTMQDFMSP